MGWLRATLIAVLALIVALGAMAVWLTQADLSFLKPQLERLIAKQTGRAFTIGGEFSLNAGRRTAVVAGDVRVGNAEWAQDPDMVRIGRARLELDLLSLLSGPARIHLIEVADAHVFLENPADQDGNWVIFADEADADDSLRLPVLGEIVMDGLSVTYRDPELKGPLRIEVIEARQRFDPESDGLGGSLRATVNGRPLEVSSQVSPLSALVAGQGFDFGVSLIATALTLDASGHVDDLVTPRRPALKVKLTSPDVDLITDALGAEEFGDGGLDMIIELTPEADDVALVASGDLAGLQVRVDAVADDLSLLRESRLNLRVQGPHFGRLMDVFGLEGLPDGPFQASGQVKRSGTILTLSDVLLDLDDTRLEIDGQTRGFPGIDAASLRLRLEGRELGRFQRFLSLPDWAVGPFAVAGSVEHSEGQTDTLDLTAATSMGEVSLRGPIGDPPTYAGTELSLTASGRDLRALAKAARALEPTVLEAVPAKPFKSGGRLAMTRRAFELSGVYVEIEDSRFDLQGFLSRRADLVGSRVTITARGGELESLLADAAGLDFKPAPFEVTATLERADRALEIHDLLLVSQRGGQRGGERGGERGEVRLNAELGLPFPASREADVDLVARGPDVSALPVQPERLELGPLPFEARLRASLRGDRLTVDEGNLLLGEAEIDWRGTFDLPPELSATDSNLSVAVPNLAALGRFDGEPLPAAPLSLIARASGTTTTLRLEGIEAELGASSLSGDLLIDVGGTRPRLEAKIHIPTLDVPVSEDAQEARRPPPADGRLIPDVALPIDRLKTIDGALELTMDELRFGDLTFTRGSLSGVLEDGTLLVERLEISPPSGRVQGRLAVRPEDDSATIDFELRGERVAMNVAANLEPSGEPSNQLVFDIDVDLRARGTDTRALAASLEGQIRALSDGGRIYNRQLALVFGGFGRELLGNINPFIRQDPYTDLSCVVFRFAATDGILKADPYLAVRSDKLNLVSSGFANLATERIDFTFNALPRRRLSISATELINPYVRVSGTLLKPSLSLDSRSAAVTGGAAALTGGLSLLAQATWKRTFGSRDACGKALEDLRGDEGSAALTPP